MRSKKRLVLAGGGHAHLFVLEKLIRRQPANVDITLISPFEQQIYSGMIPGMIGGQYDPGEIQINLKAMIESAGGTFVRARAVGVSPQDHVITDSGEQLEFDFLSFNIGSLSRGLEAAGGDPAVIAVKPVQNVTAMMTTLDTISRRSSGSPLRAVIIGGGAAGVELALAFDGWLRARNIEFNIRLLDSGRVILRSWPKYIRGKVENILRARRIEVLTLHEVVGVRNGMIELNGLPAIPYDLAIRTSGASAPKIFRGSGLATDGNGFLRVNEFLQSTSRPNVYGAGDCIALQGAPGLPKSGVHAVREGPILAHNLLAAMHGESMQRYRRKGRHLAILNTADGKALSNYLGFHSRIEMLLKDKIDRRFIRRFQVLAQSESVKSRVRLTMKVSL